MSDKKIVSLDYLDREAQLFKQARNNIDSNVKIIRETIDKNTRNEVEEVEQAIKNLNNKVQKILETEFIKEKTNIIEKSEEQMIKSSKLAAQTFFKVRKIIHEKDELTQQQKIQYENKLYEKILDKFMTQEEKELFNKIIKSSNILFMGNKQRISSGCSSIPMLGL